MKIRILCLVWRQSQEKKKNAAKKSAEEKKDESSILGKNKTGSSGIKSGNNAQMSTNNEETEVVELDGSRDENKENEDDDSDEIQEIPIS